MRRYTKLTHVQFCKFSIWYKHSVLFLTPLSRYRLSRCHIELLGTLSRNTDNSIYIVFTHELCINIPLCTMHTRYLLQTTTVSYFRITFLKYHSCFSSSSCPHHSIGPSIPSATNSCSTAIFGGIHISVWLRLRRKPSI